MAKKDKEVKAEVVETLPEQQLNTFLHENKDEHLNFEETVEYKVSTGSLLMDFHMEGGLPSGLHRLTGIAESGKSSESYEIMRNFFETVKNSRGILIKSEGRLSTEIRERCGINFVHKADEWKDGTCFVYEGNVFESVNSLMRDLVFNNPHKKRYMFILDSMDALILRNDLAKTADEANKVAGGALLTSDLMKRIALRLNKLGHLAIFISQVRSTIQIDQKQAREVRATSSSGGHAVEHYANFVLEFQPNFFEKSLILEDNESKPHPIKNKVLGHKISIRVKKSSNEITGQTLTYPVKHGIKGGSSIWKEYEIIDILILFEHLKKDGAWLKFNLESSLVKDIKDKFKETPEKFNGINKTVDWLEKNTEISEYLYQRCKKIISKT